MGAFVADATIKQLVLAGKAPKNAKVVILGLTFKENCPDTRNSKVADIIKRLGEFDIIPTVVDPWANEQDALREYGVMLTKIEDVKDADCVIIAVAHSCFKEMPLEELDKLYKTATQQEKVLIDVKGIYSVNAVKETGVRYWRL